MRTPVEDIFLQRNQGFRWGWIAFNSGFDPMAADRDVIGGRGIGANDWWNFNNPNAMDDRDGMTDDMTDGTTTDVTPNATQDATQDADSTPVNGTPAG